MQSTDVPAKFVTPFSNAPAVGTRRPIPAASQSGGAASLADGFSSLNFQPVGSGGIPPFGQDMNGVLFQSTGWDRWLSAGGPLLWDATFSATVGGYPRGSIVGSLANFGQYWLSLIENNMNNPDTSGVGWVLTPVGLASGLVSYPGSVTLTATDRGKLIQLSPNATVTLPINPPTGMPLSFYSNGASTIVGGTFYGGGLIGTTTITLGSTETISLVYTNPNWVVLARNAVSLPYVLTGAAVIGALGWVPVRQGGYGAMTNNSISLGWDGSSAILAAVDNNTTIVGALASQTWARGVLAPIASPIFSGNPQAPTPALSSSNAIVTTAYTSALYAPLANPAIQGQLTTTGPINAGSTMSATGNITANSGRMRASYGAFGSGDPNSGTILNDFTLITSGVGFMYHRAANGATLIANDGASVTGIDAIAFPAPGFANRCTQVVVVEGSPDGWLAGLTSPTIFGARDITGAGFNLYVTGWNATNHVWGQAPGVHYRYIAVGY